MINRLFFLILFATPLLAGNNINNRSMMTALLVGSFSLVAFFLPYVLFLIKSHDIKEGKSKQSLTDALVSSFLWQFIFVLALSLSSLIVNNITISKDFKFDSGLSIFYGADSGNFNPKQWEVWLEKLTEAENTLQSGTLSRVEEQNYTSYRNIASLLTIFWSVMWVLFIFFPFIVLGIIYQTVKIGDNENIQSIIQTQRPKYKMFMLFMIWYVFFYISCIIAGFFVSFNVDKIPETMFFDMFQSAWKDIFSGSTPSIPTGGKFI